jgi:hypothetical protein
VGRVVDGEGNPVPTAHISVCSLSLCIPGRAVGAGAFEAEIGRWIVPSDFVVHVAGRPDHADAFAPLPRTSNNAIELGDIRALAFNERAGVLHESGTQKLTAGDATLEIDAETVVTFPLTDVDDAARTFRTAKHATGGDVRELAFAPYGASFNAPAHLTIGHGVAGARYDVSLVEDDLTAGTAGTIHSLGIVTADAAGDARIAISKLTTLVLRTLP